MRTKQKSEDNLRNELYPARVMARDAAEILGFGEHDIPILVSKKKLKPLGKPVPNATKYFATCEIEKYAHDPKWLHDATQALYDYWKEKNDRKSVVKLSNGRQGTTLPDEISLSE